MDVEVSEGQGRFKRPDCDRPRNVWVGHLSVRDLGDSVPTGPGPGFREASTTRRGGTPSRLALLVVVDPRKTETFEEGPVKGAKG